MKVFERSKTVNHPPGRFCLVEACSTEPLYRARFKKEGPECLDVYRKSPESGERQYNSRVRKRRVGTTAQRRSTASTLSWALAAHMSRSKLSFSNALICTMSRRNPASASTNSGSEKGDLVPRRSGAQQLRRFPGRWRPTCRGANCLFQTP